MFYVVSKLLVIYIHNAWWLWQTSVHYISYMRSKWTKLVVMYNILGFEKGYFYYILTEMMTNRQHESSISSVIFTIKSTICEPFTLQFCIKKYAIIDPQNHFSNVKIRCSWRNLLLTKRGYLVEKRSSFT